MRKEKKHKPTARQIKLARSVKKNIRNGNQKSSGELAREAGYTNTTSEHTSNIFSRESFLECFNEIFTKEEVRKQHQELSNSKTLETQSFSAKISNAEIKKQVEAMGWTLLDIAEIKVFGKKIAYIAMPEHRAKAKGLEMVNKIQGNYAAEKIEHKGLNMTDEELQDRIDEMEKQKSRSKEFNKAPASPRKPPQKKKKKKV